MLDTINWIFKDSVMFPSTQPLRYRMLRVRRPWDFLESDDELQMRFSEEDVMMCIDDSSLAIKSQRK
ncbi:hypothetical protein SUGI_1026490 [Cryptomeria japonica]|nr:hypothetical protein SUGI_1026490 [Cryptomeria japonica]